MPATTTETMKRFEADIDNKVFEELENQYKHFTL